MFRTTTRVAALTLAAIASAAVASAPAYAGDDDVIREGSCSAGSDYKLKASEENGAIEVEFEVDSNVVGQTWKVKLTDNGARIFQGQKTTTAPSGSFEARVVTPNRAGQDTIKGQARNPQTGETCSAQLVYP